MARMARMGKGAQGAANIPANAEPIRNVLNIRLISVIRNQSLTASACKSGTESSHCPERINLSHAATCS